MNREDVISMARESGLFESLEFHAPSASDWKGDDGLLAELERFAALVAAAEREACAQVAEWTPCLTTAPDRIAAAIRARSKP